MKRARFPVILVLFLLPALLAAQPKHYLEKLVPSTLGIVSSYAFIEKPAQGYGGRVTQAILSTRINNLLSQNLSAPLGSAEPDHAIWDPKGHDGPSIGGKALQFLPGSLGVEFAVKVKLGGESRPAAYPWTAGSASERTASLMVAGPRAKLAPFSPGKNHIWVGCPDGAGKIEWASVPLEKKAGIPHPLPNGFVTGRAGFFTENGMRMFFVEYLAWPEDPVEIGD